MLDHAATVFHGKLSAISMPCELKLVLDLSESFWNVAFMNVEYLHFTYILYSIYLVMDIYAFLESHGITYQRFNHPAVFTCEQANELRMPMPGKDTKNLFLRDEKGKRHFLVSVGHEKQVDIKALKTILDTQKLSFASPERLKTYLGVEPGAVTLLGLINDSGHAVEIFIDEAVWNAEAICCHPLVNTATLCIPHSGMELFLSATGHTAHVVDIPKRSPSSGA